MRLRESTTRLPLHKLNDDDVDVDGTFSRQAARTGNHKILIFYMRSLFGFFSLIFRASQLLNLALFPLLIRECMAVVGINIIFPHRELPIASIRMSLRSLSACTHNPPNASRNRSNDRLMNYILLAFASHFSRLSIMENLHQNPRTTQHFSAKSHLQV